MKYRKIPGLDEDASVIALGTWVLGGDGWGGAAERDSIDAIHAAHGEGINIIDTAPIYGFGVSEEVVGKAIKDRRDKVILATKCGMRWDTDQGTFAFEDGAGNRMFKVLSAEGIKTEVDRSLKRLGTDYIDLYQTHWPDETTAIRESMEALLEVQKAGKIRAIGVSNVDVPMLEDYLAVGPVSTDQEMFSMLDRDLEPTLFARCRQEGIAVLAYSPMAMGLLTGKITPERQFEANDQRSWSPRFTVENRRKVAALLDKLQPYADAHGMTLAQLVLDWTVQCGSVAFTLVGARNRKQAEENAVGGEGRLTPEAVADISAIVETWAPLLPHPFLTEE